MLRNFLRSFTRRPRSDLLMEEKKTSSMLVDIAKGAPVHTTDSIPSVTILEGGSSTVRVCASMEVLRAKPRNL